MAKEKLKIIELELGINVNNLSELNINNDTRKRINHLMNQAKTEKEALDKIKNKKRNREKTIEKCYKIFVKAQEKGLEISADKLKEISGENNLSSLILRLKNHIKKTDNLWKISKRQSKGKILYKFIPS